MNTPNAIGSQSDLSSNPQSADEVTAAFARTQLDIEAERTALARILHDDLGGLLVGAVMDVGWVSAQEGLSDTVKEKLRRALGLLKSAVDLKRSLIERLRPSLLENVGLYSTLRWHLEATCDAAGVPYTEKLPDAEHPLALAVRTNVFRIFQEALQHVLANYRNSELTLEVEIVENTLHCRLKHIGERAESDLAASPEAAIRVRAAHVGGDIHWQSNDTGTQLHLRIPAGLDASQRI